MTKPRLDDHKKDVYSQFGEDGVVAYILSTIGTEHRTAVEFGAGDGISCSNTAYLWRKRHWKALLIEPDQTRFEELEGNARLFDTVRLQSFVEPGGSKSIASILQDHQIEGVDYMSIDIDGDDFFIFQYLECSPRVISIEFNPTIPPHLDVRQREVGGTFGASLLSLIRLGVQKGYQFIGATYCNAFFVHEAEAEMFSSLETDPTVLFEPSAYTYAVTDFAGRIVLCGQGLPWGPADPYVLPLEASTNVLPVTNSEQQIRRGFESLWGPSLWLTPDGLSEERLTDILSGEERLVCINLTWANPESVQWMCPVSEARGYRPVQVGRVLGLIKEH